MSILDALTIEEPNELEDDEQYDNEDIEEEEEDLFQTTLDDIDNFDNNAWNKGNGYILPNYPFFTEYLEGLDSGLYLVAGPSNHGKSALLLNLIEDACTYDKNKLFGLYFSLDDSKDEIIARVIAMDQAIPIGAVAKPQRYRNIVDELYNSDPNNEKCDLYEEYLRKRQIGLQNLRNKSSKLKIVDQLSITNIDDMHDYIERVLEYIKELDIENNLIIGIDSINDVRLAKVNSNTNVIAEVSKIVKGWTVEFKCPIFASSHIRKLNGNRRPALDDLKESTELVYEASVTFIVYNDVSANQDSAKIFQQLTNAEHKEPILEVHWAKNKKSSYKGRTYCYFKPEYSKTLECTEQDTKRYSSLIYEI